MNNQVNEILHKEIDIIQECIKRMADCSFKLKGWYISLVTLALTLLIGQGCKLSIVALFLFVVTTVFWGMDARQNDNMENLYDLNPYNKKMWKDADKKNSCIMKYMLSKTLCPLYGTVWMIAVGIIMYIVFQY